MKKCGESVSFPFMSRLTRDELVLDPDRDKLTQVERPVPGPGLRIAMETDLTVVLWTVVYWVAASALPPQATAGDGCQKHHLLLE